MQINSINTSNNAPTFGRVFFHNKKQIAKLSREVIENLVDTDAIKTFSKRKDYDLHITTDVSRKIFKYKIKSVGQGIHGLINNFIAPWKKMYTTALFKNDCDEYIDMWHPSKEAIKRSRRQAKKDEIERKIRLKKIETEDNRRQREHIRILNEVEKQFSQETK